jgi:hypothetical protein
MAAHDSQTHSKTTHHVKPSRKKIEPSKKDRERISKTLAQGCYSNINIASVPSKPSFEQVERYAYSFEALLFQR